MIRLFKGIKYDNNYDYVKLFATPEDQLSYFNSFDSWDFPEHNYVKNVDYIDVGANYDDLMRYGANYLSYTNVDKVYYAFITDKKYINKNVTRVFYEIDVMQTFLFDFTLNSSFVERKVCSLNELTDFDEGLEIGEHIQVDEFVAINKTYEYFAMFNGIKEQSIVFDSYGKFQNCIEVPYVSAKPMTMIDGIQYPLYFMPLKDEYP